MIAAFCLTSFLAIATIEDQGKEKLAEQNTRVLVQAVKFYYVKNGQWPRQLVDIAPFLENGKKDLLNPWGIPYQYTIGEDEKGNESAFV